MRGGWAPLVYIIYQATSSSVALRSRGSAGGSAVRDMGAAPAAPRDRESDMFDGESEWGMRESSSALDEWDDPSSSPDEDPSSSLDAASSSHARYAAATRGADSGST